MTLTGPLRVMLVWAGITLGLDPVATAQIPSANAPGDDPAGTSPPPIGAETSIGSPPLPQPSLPGDPGALAPGSGPATAPGETVTPPQTSVADPSVATQPATGSGDDEVKFRPYIFPTFAALFRDDFKSSSGASYLNRRKGTSNPILPGPGGQRAYDDEQTAIRLRYGRSRRSISFPGPDSAGFPNSSFTLPKGRLYIENNPLAIYTASKTRNFRYNSDFLLRYGLTDNVEFRLFSNGFTYEKIHPATFTTPNGTVTQSKGFNTSGFSPLAFDLKIHLWDENRKYFVPSTALEVYIQTPFGSPRYSSGTQPSASLNFDQGLPLDFTLEYAVGIAGNQNPDGSVFYQTAFQYALQHNVVGNFDVFVHGFLNNANLPRLGISNRNNESTTETVVGVGGIWTPNDRIAIFGSYNFGVIQPDSHPNIALLGFAISL